MKDLDIVKLTATDAISMGHEHGEMLRESIKEIAEIRLEIMCKTSHYKTSKSAMNLAKEHLPILQDFDQDLFLELKGISEASNVAIEKIVILNNLTDLRDINNTDYKSDDDPGGCSIIYAQGNDGAILGQTWDIHGSAEPYANLMKINDTLLFSIAGCLGMTGINNHGVSVAINNLSSTDAHPGVIWPALARKALKQKNAILAKDVIMNANIGSGRHFAIADAKNFFAIETSGTKKKIICDDSDKTFIHTNHCVDKEMRKTHVIRKGSTTIKRYDHLSKVIKHKNFYDAAQVFLTLAEVSYQKNPDDINKTATCGTFVMDINKRFALACRGISSEEVLRCPSTKIYID